jgi:hypothetical protein
MTSTLLHFTLNTFGSEARDLSQSYKKLAGAAKGSFTKKRVKDATGT